MLKNDLRWVTANRNHPDASDLRAARSVVDLLTDTIANIVPNYFMAAYRIQNKSPSSSYCTHLFRASLAEFAYEDG
jgi:hypothetical protein